MLCSKPGCNNLLSKNTSGNQLKFKCNSCGSEFPSTDRDSLIFEESNRTFIMYKSGKSIYNYPANPKVFKDCISCKYAMVAYEVNLTTMKKTYGCGTCNTSWQEENF